MFRSRHFWYYFAIFVVIVIFFIFADFSGMTPSVRLLLIVFFSCLLVAPVYFWITERETELPPTVKKAQAVITPEQSVELSLLKNVNSELEAKIKDLKSKDAELASANERLQDLDKAKSQFVSMTTHQLRTPLAAIKWTFHMVMNGELGPVTEDQKHFLQKGYDSAERVITVINDWLNIDYIEANKDEYKFVPVNIVELIDGVIFEFTGKLNDKKINLVVNKPKLNIPQVEIDPIKMSMVIENLIDNAIKYTPIGGQVTVSIIDDKINTADKALELVFADSGIGIPAAEQPKIFSRFFRSTNAVKVQAQGSGLGLSIVREIVEKHQGNIRFESKENEGTKFVVTIPIKQNKV